MSRPRFTVEEKRDAVFEYLSVPYGRRTQWLREKDLRPESLRSWRRQLAAGTLEVSLIPREGRSLLVEENIEFSRLHEENKRLKVALDKARADADRQLKVSEALGKAIELLQDAKDRKSADSEMVQGTDPAVERE